MTSAPGGERRYPKSYRWKGGCGDYILPGEGVNNAVNIPEVICTWLLKAPSLIKNRCVWCELRSGAWTNHWWNFILLHTNAFDFLSPLQVCFTGMILFEWSFVWVKINTISTISIINHISIISWLDDGREFWIDKTFFKTRRKCP